jgi:tetratricopeptide (TPR) repeat protein
MENREISIICSSKNWKQKSGFIVLIFALLFTNTSFSQYSIDSLLRQLDLKIENKQAFATKKEHTLDSLKSQLQFSNSPDKKLGLYSKLFLAYEHYNLDGALRAAKEKRAIALQVNNKKQINEAEMNIAQVMGKMGMYKESFEILEHIEKDLLQQEDLPYYYHIFHSTYLLLYESALSEEERFKYNRLIQSYKDTLLSLFDSSSSRYKLVLAGKYIDDGMPDKAYSLTLHAFNNADVGFERPQLYYSMALAYESIGEIENQKIFLAKASIRDIENAVKSYIALRKLAVILYQQGDLERAYRYIKCAMEDAHFAKARFRMLEISETLPIITANYDKKMQEDKRRLTIYLLVISMLTLILILAVGFIYKQLQKISAAEEFVKRKNNELIEINQQLKALNDKLSEADHVKEAYIGYVFKLYSSYINKLEDYRINLNKKLRGHQLEEALRITSSGNLINQELKEFFQNFDAIFLGIFPRFIDDFNEMLSEEEKIYAKADDILTPELRVFALMRLGITDSGKIAELLHYSPQTVYNYKLKIKNRLCVSKEEFNQRILQIGR